MRPRRTGIAFCAVFTAFASWVPVSGAQNRSDPADPAAPVPAAAYRSVFADFRPMGEGKVGDWRAANDEVGRIGGWKAYAREAQAPDSAPAAPASAAPASAAPASAPYMTAPAAPASGGHGHHGMPGGKR